MRYLLFSFLLFVQSISFAQKNDDFSIKYNNGLNFLKNQQWNDAKATFLPLTSLQSENNPYKKQAHYFYALAAFKTDETEQAKNMLLQLLQRFPEWDQKDEAYYLLAAVYFKESKHRLAMQFLKKQSMGNDDSKRMKAFYLKKVNPTDSLVALQETYPNDKELATETYYRLQAERKTTGKYANLLRYLEQEYKFTTPTAAPAQNIKKTNYTIAVMLPFQMNELDPKSQRRSNQYILEMYEGMKLAEKELNESGMKIKLAAYDSEKEPVIVQSIIALPEMKKMDLIIGPVYPQQIPVITEFAQQNKIFCVNPISVNSKYTQNNDFSYLYQSSIENQCGYTANYALNNFIKDTVEVVTMIGNRKKKEEIVLDKKNVIIFYGTELKDSLLAYAYKDSCTKLGFSISDMQKLKKGNISYLKTVFGDSLKLNTISHLFAALSDEIVASNIINAMEITQRDIPIITRSDWMNFNLISYDQFESRKVHFIHNDFIDMSDSTYTVFKYNYANKVKLYPGIWSNLGYEMIHFYGKLLWENGTNISVPFNQNDFIEGKLFTGYHFKNSKSNKFITITTFKEKRLILAPNQNTNENKY